MKIKVHNSILGLTRIKSKWHQINNLLFNDYHVSMYGNHSNEYYIKLPISNPNEIEIIQFHKFNWTRI